jgi:hypothetical protein
MRKVLRGYAKDKDGNLILIGTIPVPHSKDKRSPRERQDKRYLTRQGAASARTACSGLRVVHGRPRHARSEGGEGALGGIGVVSPWNRAADIEKHAKVPEEKSQSEDQ